MLVTNSAFFGSPSIVYHSSFINEEGIAKACGCPLLPLKSHIKGPAPVYNQGGTDVVDEAMSFFRANVFFRNFDIQSSADKLLIYFTFYINVALKKLEGCRTLAEGTRQSLTWVLKRFLFPVSLDFHFQASLVYTKLGKKQPYSNLAHMYLIDLVMFDDQKRLVLNCSHSVEFFEEPRSNFYNKAFY